MDTPDSEFFRVVRHEKGHTLGLRHEHLRREIVHRIDRQKAIDYFMKTQGRAEQQVIINLLSLLDYSALMATENGHH